MNNSIGIGIQKTKTICNNSTNCIGEDLFHNCQGIINFYNIEFRYRPNPGMRYSGNYILSKKLCHFHYNYIININQGILPYIYYEYDMEEAIERLFGILD
jgi:hypothetical protein